VLEVTLDRPKANAIDLATSRIMGEVFTEFRDDPDLRVAIITGAGEKFFCPGWDLKAAADGRRGRWRLRRRAASAACRSCAG
jgi:crotonobetainyl-CoA hydratase